MEMPDIRSLVPHTGAMLLLDRVLAMDADSLCAEVVIRDDSLFCADGGVGSWVGIEYMAQAIAAHAGHLARLRGQPVTIGFLLGSRRYDCAHSVFAVGSVLRVFVRCLLLADNGLGSYECRIEDDHGIAANAVVSVFQPANAEQFLERGSV
jgi:predicted hotdog family 3-hydroxylacyl-ACP dehydratase